VRPQSLHAAGSGSALVAARRKRTASCWSPADRRRSPISTGSLPVPAAPSSLPGELLDTLLPRGCNFAQRW